VCSSGELTEAFEAKEFEPFDSRLEEEESRTEEVKDPEGESLDEIVEAGRRWAVRHGVRRRAGRERKASREKGKAELVLEAIVIDGERHERGYAIEWSVLNAKGKKVGDFWWNDTGDS
jgi:hypothetical protein